MFATSGELFGWLVCCCMMGNEQFDVDTLCEKQQTFMLDVEALCNIWLVAWCCLEMNNECSIFTHCWFFWDLVWLGLPRSLWCKDVKTNNLNQQRYGKFQQLLMEVLGFVFFLSSLKYMLAL
jgi:hypothetical protein